MPNLCEGLTLVNMVYTDAQKTSCVAVIAVIMAFTLLDLRVGKNLPLVMACQRVTLGMRMVKHRFDGKLEFSTGRIQYAAKKVTTCIALE